MNQSRRNFIKNTSIISLGFLGLNQFVAAGCRPSADLGYGPLYTPADGVLRLPKGFSAQVISRKGAVMSDGFFTPGMYDGMGVFTGTEGKVILVRNHENLPGVDEQGPFGAGNQLLNRISRDRIYDYAGGQRTCVGGTTTLVYDEQRGRIETE